MVAVEYKELRINYAICDSCTSYVRQYYRIIVSGKFLRANLCVPCYNDKSRTTMIDNAALIMRRSQICCYSCNQYESSNSYTIIFDTSNYYGLSIDVCLNCLTTNMRGIIDKINEFSRCYMRDIVELIGYRYYTPGQRYIELLNHNEKNTVKIERILLRNNMSMLPGELISVVLSYYWIFEH